MISIENLSDISKKLLYIQNVRPLLRKEALFSDGTEDYVIPPQPGIGEEVKIRFRTAKANADCDSNGTVTADDSMTLLKFLVHLINELPVK